MMEMEQAAESCSAPDQATVNTGLSPSTKGVTRTPSDTASRFHGVGVRYKAKLIGVDLVPKAHGDKMCWDSMMKLKGIEAIERRQGKHKRRVWLKISTSGLKIEDERTRAVLHDHMTERISSLTKDKSDPRALAYIYQQQDTYSLFYIKMTNPANPVLADIKEVCQRADQETPQDATEKNRDLLILDESSAPPPPEASSSDELMEVFTIQREEPCTSLCQPESPQQTLSNRQILSMFPGSPYSSPTYSPTAMPWGQQGLLVTQWAGPMCVAPCPTMHVSMATWVATPAPHAGSQIQAHSSHPNTVNGNPIPLNSPYTPPGATATLQFRSPSMDPNPFQ